MNARRIGCYVVSVGTLLTAGVSAGADTLTIYDLQFSSQEAGWRSAYEGQVVSVAGGVVIHKVGFRIALQDPTLGDAWAGIEIRAWQNTAPLGAVEVGDRVDFFDLYVEEFVGGTIPQFTDSSGFEIMSSGNPLPEPVSVPLEDLRHPPDRSRCEKYEGMLLAVEDVRVGRMDWGKAEDNYQLFAGPDTSWASDYYNLDLAAPPFPTYYVSRGERYSRVVGVYQEYNKPEEGWDYYQLLPRGEADYEKSDLYTIRDVQESSAEDGWASLLSGSRIRLQAMVSSQRSDEGRLCLADPVLGNAWAGIFLADPGAELTTLARGDEVDLRNVLVGEEEQVTLLTFDAESSFSIVGSGHEIEGGIVPASELDKSAGPEKSEKYEGMLTSVYNVTVCRRGVSEGSDLYYLVAGEDTLLGLDLESETLAPDSTFFVREGDLLGRIRGIVNERPISAGSCFVIQPRGAEDYWFVGRNQELSSWGRIKRSYR